MAEITNEPIESTKIKITTESGFTCQVDENALDNMRVVEQLVNINTAKDRFAQLGAYIAVTEALIGPEGKENLYSFLEKAVGRASSKGFGKIVGEILTELSPAKKKS